VIGPRSSGGIRRTRAEAEALAAAAAASDRAAWLAALLRRAHPSGSCRLFVGATTGQYGQVRFFASTLLTHRLAYILASGQVVPDGVVVRHKCDTPRCVNPDHLETGTPAENIRDAVDRGRIRHCNTVPTERLPEIIARRQAGETLASIGRDFGVTREAIRLLVKHHGPALAEAA
jgi:hypothetical protein